MFYNITNLVNFVSSFFDLPSCGLLNLLNLSQEPMFGCVIFFLFACQFYALYFFLVTLDLSILYFIISMCTLNFYFPNVKDVEEDTTEKGRGLSVYFTI